ncbi:TPA: ABC transporter [Candidatus Kaiserbacteria bacterium]|nr:MAG: ABC transporter ATP-binding protein [Parcubacteria group bacterium GW2011_GWA1_56_13]KKW46622.1 MAG: ABC transporter ATP-binding protein [Parcubacteria group bacterium GW2011_GWB1_57_6]HCR52731.1 ABC transporter [Candidatus Kaiserbacteria bacterium]
MTEPALVVNNLEKTYAGESGRAGTHALAGVSLTVEKGDFFALLGPNGAGKTTLIGIVTGLVNKTGGKVSVHGVDIDTAPEKARTYIGVVPQNMNLDYFGKVSDIVVNQAGYYGIPRSVAIPRAERIFKDLGLYEKRNDQARMLSGGMMRRLMIARALIHEPQFLILDEPTAGVDVELRRSMWEYLTGLTKAGVTILLTTHYLEEAERLANKVAIINKGEIIVNGTMAEVLTMHDSLTSPGAGESGYRGGKLEEIFLQLTKEK